jgi:predicted phosphodiesterase
MKYAVLSDIHANPEALGHVLKDAEACGVQQIVCLGDIVGYGPLPAEALRLVRESCSVVLAGNHDDAVSGRGDASAFVSLAGDAVERHREALEPSDLDWLRTLPHSCELEGARAAHGDITDPPKFYYVENEEDAVANFLTAEDQLVFVGHTHEPCIFLTGGSGKVYRIEAQDFMLEDGKRYIVNVGSVGYPREANGQCASSYVLYDSSEGSVAYRAIPFSVASVMQRGRNPKRLARRTLAALVGAAALAAGTIAWMLAPKSVEVADDPALVLAEKTLPLERGTRAVRANLRLAKGSSSVALRLAFKNADATDVQPAQAIPVKKSSSGKFTVPAGAAAVTFTVLKARTEDRPELAAFTPAVEK